MVASLVVLATTFAPEKAFAYAVIPSSITSAGVSSAFPRINNPAADYAFFFGNTSINTSNNEAVNPYPSLDWESVYGSNGDGVYYLYSSTVGASCGTNRTNCEINATARVAYTRSGGVWTSDYVPDTTERIISVDSPVGIVNSPVTFTIVLWNEESTQVKINLTNYDASLSLLPITLGLPAVSGLVSTTTTTVLSNGLYSATAQLVHSDGSVVDSFLFSFTVGESAFRGTLYASSTAAASTTSAICSDEEVASTSPFVRPFLKFGCALVVPSPIAIDQFKNLSEVIKTKIPFVYFYDIQNIVASSSANAASSTLGTFTLVIGTTTDVFHLNVVLFSPATIRYFIPDNLASTLSVVVLASVWLGFAWYLYRRITALLADKTQSK